METWKLTVVMRCSLLLAAAWLSVSATHSFGETFVQATVETRVVLAYRVDAKAIQQTLPSPWKLNPIAKGPLQGANLFVIFGDRELDQNPDGTPKTGGIARFTAFAAPATNPDTGKSGAFVLRIFTANSEDIPGAYKTNVLASVSRRFSYSGTDMAFGVAEDEWQVRAQDQADIHLAMSYKKSLPSRADREFDVYSSVEPDFYRIYRVDQGTNIVMSEPMNINDLLAYDARINVAEYDTIFDGNEELVAVAVLPWYVRKVFLP